MVGLQRYQTRRRPAALSEGVYSAAIPRGWDIVERIMVPVGHPAPDFSLPSHTGATVHLSDLRGRKNVVVAFHPLAFTPVCAVQVKTYDQARARFESFDARVVSVSVDAAPAKKGWSDALGGISHDMLADFHPKGAVASAYGVMRDDGISGRAVFVVDKAGTIVWAKEYAIPEQPDVEEIFAALAAISGSSSL
jgi:peroxiredoxin